MISLKTASGLSVKVPETIAEDISPKFTLEQLDEASNYYKKHGYVVFNKLIDVKKCKEIRKIWDSEIKSSTKYVYRQTSGKPEKNILNKKGWVMNPILNIQSLNPKHFNLLRKTVVNDIFGSKKIQTCFVSLLYDKPKIVQSMYFEGNAATMEHQDTYYLDSEKLGEMAAGWLALEDISAKAGRFFVCSESNKIEMVKHNSETNISFNHNSYINKIVKTIQDKKLEIRAPFLKAGDVLFWNAWTIHGSLKSEDKTSRSSITIHAIPSSKRFQQFQNRVFKVPTDDVNGTKVWRPKDQARLKNRMIMFFASSFPRLFYFIKKYVIKIMID